MAYIDGYTYAVASADKDVFIEFAQKSAELFKKHGALRVVECWQDEVPDGETTSFPLAVKRKDDEVVMFSWCEWPDKATRDASFDKVMKDWEEAGLGDMPFDGKRMIYGGFVPVVDV